jgi:peptide chain release factor 2
MRSGGFFDIERKTQRFQELELVTQANEFWNDKDKATILLKEQSHIKSIIENFKKMENLLADANASLELAIDTKDAEMIAEVEKLSSELEALVYSQEFIRKMSGEFDKDNAILEFNGGSGGTEAQDWAEMLMRMYVRWAERKGYRVEVFDYQAGEVAGIKSATIFIEGEYAYGHLRSEHGVHRLVRISPFDSNARRHTSFASVTVTPDIEEEIKVDIDEKDLRIDTYRSSGAGGQHVNKTDSAVRLTHIPSGIVVACQNERSQHKNKDRAMKILKAKLFELQKQAQADKIDEVKGQRKKIDFGSQIRSYVMQPYQMVKDHRTDFESSAVNAILDGDLDAFIENFLMSS